MMLLVQRQCLVLLLEELTLAHICEK
jgi:hypothetical protein